MNLLNTLMAPLQTFAAGCDKPEFFGLKPWYYYLQLQQDPNTGQCEVINFVLFEPGKNSSFLLIALVIVDDLLRVAAMVAVGFLIWGGIQYVTSQGSPDATGKAQNTIINALVGLVIALISAGFVSFLGNRLA